ncbi:MAG TPA: cyclase family protein [Vicinamibacterales bacterium]|jgi:kynurenine formamidase|nr:cyclase family protein [Vicinamibacterales bacterium]
MFADRRWWAAGVVVTGVLLACSSALGQSDRWYPSRWGADDQRGAANRLTPAKVLEAKNLITKGNVYQLGHVYEPGMPMYGTRHFSLRIPQAFKMPGKNEAVYHDEIISGELGQIGTQFDGLGHLGIGDLFYNGNRRSEFAQAEGLTKLGIENVGAIVTRGVLIDVAKFKGVDQLPMRYEITPADLKGALQREGVQIRSGDMVLIHTGWSSLWMKDNAKYGDSEPGIGLAAGQMLVDAEVVVVGADTWGVEVMPNPDSSLSAPVHQLFLARNGIYLHENLITADLARDTVYEFVYMFAPLRLKGATGSPGNPIAIR